MAFFGQFYLDKEKDMVVELYLEGERMDYVLRTPNHKTGNLITNLAKICELPLSLDDNGLKVIRGTLPCYFHRDYKKVYIMRLRDTKVANIYPDGTIETKASIPAIAKTLMSQTKDYQLDFEKTVVKTYILNDYKFRTDLHTHLNANLQPDILIALGIFHQIRYPLYYIKKLKLRLTDRQWAVMKERRKIAEKQYENSKLQGKYLDRKIDDATFMNFADLIVNNLENCAYNLPLIRASLTILKDGQAVFTNLEKVYVYRYVFTKGITSKDVVSLQNYTNIPDADIVHALQQMFQDCSNPCYMHNTLYQNKLLWTARMYQENGIVYAEISDTNLIKPGVSLDVLQEIHAVMPAIQQETGVTLRFLAAFRRIPLTIIKDQIPVGNPLQENLRILQAILVDPYVAGCDIVGEEINDIRQLQPLIQALTQVARLDESFVLRIHAGENDSLTDNVANSIACVKESLAPGQTMPHMRLGHGLYTADLKSEKGKALLQELVEDDIVLEFLITSNVRLNNLTSLQDHPLKHYLASGVQCVQGTDGGALYGTDSVDEQLALVKMLNLHEEDLAKMWNAEHKILERSLEAFQKKQERFAKMRETMSLDQLIETRRKACEHDFDWLKEMIHKVDSEDVVKQQIQPLPNQKMPIVICGGSYNNDNHVTILKEMECRLLDRLMETADPSQVYFVLGNRMTGYEKYVYEKAKDRFEIFSFLPKTLEEKEVEEYPKDAVSYRISIESEPMGLYKSVAYEIFKQRESILLALDGNSAAMNLIQEANNSKYDSHIFVDGQEKALRDKAESLQGYLTIFYDDSILTQLQKYIPSLL